VAAGLAVVAADLRGASPSAGDLTAAAPDAVQLRSTIGAAVACAVAGNAADFPAGDAARDAGLAAWRAAPRAGDTLAVYHPGDSATPARWTAHAVASFAPSGGACPAADPLGGGGPGSRVVVDAATPLPVHAGAGTPVRVLRHVRYAVYAAADGRLQLGFSDYRAGGGWATVQPVAGPFAEAAFRYLDGAGAEVGADDRARAARVVLTLRADAGAAPARLVPGGARDSASVATRGQDE
jgi:hypothetical protein